MYLDKKGSVLMNLLPIWVVKLFYSRARYCTGILKSLPDEDIAFIRRVAKILNAKVEYLP